MARCLCIIFDCMQILLSTEGLYTLVDHTLLTSMFYISNGDG